MQARGNGIKVHCVIVPMKSTEKEREREPRDPEGLQVFIRIRPPPRGAAASTCITSSSTSLTLRSDRHDVSCSYDHVFSEFATQSDVFRRVQPLLQGVLRGINGSILAYGQTSAGKSYTMLGPEGGQDLMHQSPANWGILPRAAEFLLGTLAELAEEGHCTYVVKCSFLQIYNEGLHDLLGSRAPSMAVDNRDEARQREGSSGAAGHGGGAYASSSSSGSSSLKIRELPVLDTANPHMGFCTGPQEVYVSGLSEYRVHTGQDVLQLLRRGTDGRTTAATEFNATSSRSHAVLQMAFEVTLTGQGAGTSSSGRTTHATHNHKQASPASATAAIAADYSSRGVCTLRSKLSLVDLAGSEKMTTLTTGLPSTGGVLEQVSLAHVSEARHVRELSAINKSLSALGNVIAALGATPPRSHVPYRDSKVRHLLLLFTLYLRPVLYRNNPLDKSVPPY